MQFLTIHTSETHLTVHLWEPADNKSDIEWLWKHGDSDFIGKDREPDESFMQNGDNEVPDELDLLGLNCRWSDENEGEGKGKCEGENELDSKESENKSDEELMNDSGLVAEDLDY